MDNFRTISRQQLRQTVRYVPGLDLVYLNNPKVACTSIKLALWRKSDEISERKSFDGGNVHRIKGAPWDNLFACDRERLATATFFTVVRNPYDRLLSAYLSKSRGGTGPFVTWCERRIGGMPKSFAEFARRVVQVPDEERDHHVRSQWMNVMWPYVRFGFVGRLEDMKALNCFLGPYGVKVPHWRGNATNAATKLGEHYDDETKLIVAEAYTDDFKLWRGELEPAKKTVICELI